MNTVALLEDESSEEEFKDCSCCHLKLREALQILKLDDASTVSVPVTRDVIKEQYFKLGMAVHPHRSDKKDADAEDKEFVRLTHAVYAALFKFKCSICNNGNCKECWQAKMIMEGLECLGKDLQDSECDEHELCNIVFYHYALEMHIVNNNIRIKGRRKKKEKTRPSILSHDDIESLCTFFDHLVAVERDIESSEKDEEEKILSDDEMSLTLQNVQAKIDRSHCNSAKRKHRRARLKIGEDRTRGKSISKSEAKELENKRKHELEVIRTDLLKKAKLADEPKQQQVHFARRKGIFDEDMLEEIERQRREKEDRKRDLQKKIKNQTAQDKYRNRKMKRNLKKNLNSSSSSAYPTSLSETSMNSSSDSPTIDSSFDFTLNNGKKKDVHNKDKKDPSHKLDVVTENSLLDERKRSVMPAQDMKIEDSKKMRLDDQTSCIDPGFDKASILAQLREKERQKNKKEDEEIRISRNARKSRKKKNKSKSSSSTTGQASGQAENLKTKASYAKDLDVPMETDYFSMGSDTGRQPCPSLIVSSSSLESSYHSIDGDLHGYSHALQHQTNLTYADIAASQRKSDLNRNHQTKSTQNPAKSLTTYQPFQSVASPQPSPQTLTPLQHSFQQNNHVVRNNAQIQQGVQKLGSDNSKPVSGFNFIPPDNPFLSSISCPLSQSTPQSSNSSALPSVRDPLDGSMKTKQSGLSGGINITGTNGSSPVLAREECGRDLSDLKLERKGKVKSSNANFSTKLKFEQIIPATDYLNISCGEEDLIRLQKSSDSLSSFGGCSEYNVNDLERKLSDSLNISQFKKLSNDKKEDTLDNKLNNLSVSLNQRLVPDSWEDDSGDSDKECLSSQEAQTKQKPNRDAQNDICQHMNRDLQTKVDYPLCFESIWDIDLPVLTVSSKESKTKNERTDTSSTKDCLTDSFCKLDLSEALVENDGNAVNNEFKSDSEHNAKGKLILNPKTKKWSWSPLQIQNEKTVVLDQKEEVKKEDLTMQAVISTKPNPSIASQKESRGTTDLRSDRDGENLYYNQKNFSQLPKSYNPTDPKDITGDPFINADLTKNQLKEMLKKHDTFIFKEKSETKYKTSQEIPLKKISNSRQLSGNIHQTTTYHNQVVTPDFTEKWNENNPDSLAASSLAENFNLATHSAAAVKDIPQVTKLASLKPADKNMRVTFPAKDMRRQTLMVENVLDSSKLLNRKILHPIRRPKTAIQCMQIQGTQAVGGFTMPTSGNAKPRESRSEAFSRNRNQNGAVHNDRVCQSQSLAGEDIIDSQSVRIKATRPKMTTQGMQIQTTSGNANSKESWLDTFAWDKNESRSVQNKFSTAQSDINTQRVRVKAKPTKRVTNPSSLLQNALSQIKEERGLSPKSVSLTTGKPKENIFTFNMSKTIQFPSYPTMKTINKLPKLNIAASSPC